jgi:hypothetical protein
MSPLAVGCGQRSTGDPRLTPCAAARLPGPSHHFAIPPVELMGSRLPRRSPVGYAHARPAVAGHMLRTSMLEAVQASIARQGRSRAKQSIVEHRPLFHKLAVIEAVFSCLFALISSLSTSHFRLPSCANNSPLAVLSPLSPESGADYYSVMVQRT